MPPGLARQDSESSQNNNPLSPNTAATTGSDKFSNILLHSREAMFTIFDRSDGSAEPHVMPQLNKLQFCFKITLLASNLVFMIFGVILIAVGAYAVSNQAGALAGASLPKGIIAMGVFVFVMSVLGAASAWKESRIFLGLYFILLLIIAIVLLTVGVAVYSARNEGETYLRQGWSKANATSPGLLTSIELNFHCCGLDTANDTISAPCPTPSDPPCLPILIDLFGKAITNAGACGIAFSVIMASGMTFVCCLMNGIKNKSVALRKQQRMRQQALEFDQSILENDDIQETPQNMTHHSSGGGGGGGSARGIR